MFIAYTTLVFLSAHLALGASEWVDPHEMRLAPSASKPQPTTKQSSEAPQCDCPAPVNHMEAHLKRLINLILSAVDRDDLHSTGRLQVNLPVDSYDFLKRFASSSDDNHAGDATLLRQVDQILSKALKRPLGERLVDSLTSWTDSVYFTFYNRTSMIISACLFVLFISYKLLKANLTIWSVVKYLIFLAWVTDFAFTWINLLQEAEINKMADSMMYEAMPPRCNPDKMTVWQYVKYSLSSTNDCRKYHQTILKDHFWSVAPVTVLSHQFGILIYTPAALIGEALGSFTSGLLAALPWGVNVILLPVLLIFSAVMMCIIFSFLTKTSFGFNFLHVLQLEFGGEQRRAIGDALSGQNLNALLHIAQRNMVEDVRPAGGVESAVRAEGCVCSEGAGVSRKPEAIGDGKDEAVAASCDPEPGSKESKIENVPQKEDLSGARHEGDGDTT